MFYKVKKHYSGLDHSGPCMVLPPTFGGVRQLVDRVGEVAAKAQFITPPDPDDASNDLVRDFLQELTYADKVERQTLINDFNSMIKDLSKQSKKPQTPAASAGAPASEAAPGSGANALDAPPAAAAPGEGEGAQ